jgi:hypothetical protein
LDASRVEPGSLARIAIAATMRALAEAHVLLTAADTLGLIPPTNRAHVRRVLGHNLWLWWKVDASELKLLFVTTSPPVPAE